MSRKDLSILEKITLADSRLTRETQAMPGSRIREIADRRLSRRRTIRTGTAVLALVALVISLVTINNRDNEQIAERAAIENPVQSEDIVLQLDGIRNEFDRLQRELEVVGAERVLLQLDRKLKFQTEFPDSLESISASNHAAQGYFSSLRSLQEHQPQLREQKLRELVSYFPGTLAAKKAASLLQ